MAGDQWRIVRRRVILCGEVFQPCVVRGDQLIPIGPFADTLEQLRYELGEMLLACDQPVIDRVEEGI